MRAGWSERLRAAVQRGDSSAGPIAEVVVLEDSHVKNTRDEWTAGTRTNVSVLSGGGVSLTPSSTTRITHTTATDPTSITRLTTGTPFDGLWIEWSGEGAQFRELRNFVARLHPRLDAGQPKEVATWVFQAYRVAVLNDDEVRVELIKQREMIAAGDVAADVTFNLTGYNNSYPRVGASPTGTLRANPITVIRIVALKADGTVAGNVSWEGSSTGGDDQSGTGYDVYHRTFNDLPGTSGGTNWFFQEDRSDLPRFTLNEATYPASGDVEFTGVAAVPDLTGSGDVSVVLRGSEPSDSLIRAFVWDGAAYVRCYDGDVLGQDNAVTVGGETFGGDLSGVPTTGPWNIRVYLDASSDGLNAPTVRDFGLEKKAATSLVGAAEVKGGGQRIADLTALKASIANLDVAIAKSGEKDFDDYGSRILATNHTGQIEIRIYVGDMTGTELARSEWMLHSTWEVETYHNRASVHQIRCLSPLRRLRKLIPPFVTVGAGPGGTRTAVELAETIEDAWLEIIDALAELPGRYVGSGPTSTDEIADTIRKADAKDTLDSISYLDGGANIESQGRIKHVRIMHDDPADEAPVFRLPIGSYEPLDIGPGFDARTDEFFVPYNWSQSAETYEDERRHVNLAALVNLGGAGLNTTQECRDEVARWIRTEALADKVGARVPKHFGTGELVWHVRSMEAMPHLEIGDIGIIETDLFVAKTPVNGRELRGPLATLCVVVGTDDVMGRGLWLWVPSYELITVLEGSTTRSGFVEPDLRAAHRVEPVPFMSDSVVGHVFDVHYDLGDDVTHVLLSMTHTSFVGGFTTSVIALTGRGVHRIMDGASPMFFAASVTDALEVGLTGQDSNAGPLVDAPRGVTVWESTGDLDVRGYGTKAQASSGGAVLLGDYIVPGSNVTIDTDSSGRPRVGVSPAGGYLHSDATNRILTGSTTETTLETITIPAGALGTDGGLTLQAHVFLSGTAGAKTIRAKFGGSNIATLTYAAADVGRVRLDLTLFNRASVSAQRSHAVYLQDGGAVDFSSLQPTIDTSAAVDLTITGLLGNSADTIRLEMTRARYESPGGA